MRITDFVWGLLIGFGLPATCSQAATLQSYAKVNLIQGTDAITDAIPVENIRVTLSGPSDRTVNLQVAVLEPKSQWWDRAELLKTRVGSLHDSSGMLRADFKALDLPSMDLPSKSPVPGFARDDEHPARLVISVIYE